jgi:hypothetical protein
MGGPAARPSVIQLSKNAESRLQRGICGCLWRRIRVYPSDPITFSNVSGPRVEDGDHLINVMKGLWLSQDFAACNR